MPRPMQIDETAVAEWVAKVMRESDFPDTDITTVTDSGPYGSDTSVLVVMGDTTYRVSVTARRL